METIIQRVIGPVTLKVEYARVENPGDFPDIRYRVSAKTNGTKAPARRTKTYKGELAWADAQRLANDYAMSLAREYGVSGPGFITL